MRSRSRSRSGDAALEIKAVAFTEFLFTLMNDYTLESGESRVCSSLVMSPVQRTATVIRIVSRGAGGKCSAGGIVAFRFGRPPGPNTSVVCGTAVVAVAKSRVVGRDS